MAKTIDISAPKITTTPTELISQAINSNLDIDKMEKLLAMQERWEASQARKSFFSALSDFQQNAPDIRKTKEVSFKETKYKYAPLADIDRQLKEPLRNCGLTKRWEIKDVGDKITVTCIITHVDGHCENTSMEANPDISGSKNQIQARGSAIEYMKRYTLIGALGITTADSDIDGRLPELDIDKLHKQYMEIYNQVIEKDPTQRSAMDPDNWKSDRTPQLYVKAIGKAREILSKLQTIKQ